MYYVYILLSKKDGRLYIGSTPNLKERLVKHNKGFVLATKNRLPVLLIHYEAYFVPEDAKRREFFLKGGLGHQELKIQLETVLRKLKYEFRFPTNLV